MHEDDHHPDTSSVPAHVRRSRMLDVIGGRDFVRTSELADRFGISEVTARTDLNALAERGHVTRVRGGAFARGPRLPDRERPFAEAEGAHADEKLRVGAAAAALVESGDSIIIDVGTTSTALARALVERADLEDVVVFTNGLNIALELERGWPRLTIVVLGGTLRPMQHSLVDPLAGPMLDRISANLVFIGCNGIDPEGGVTNANLPEAEVKRRLLGAARRRVVVADASKVGSVSLARVCDVDDLDLIITGAEADAAVLEALRERGPAVQVV
jgi:DeoR family transcriptional regulator, aga operon transcriptional repressor